MSLKIKVFEYETKRYMEVVNYKLSYNGCEQFNKKEEIDWFIKNEHAKIKLALEQLKDIEQMAKEL